MSTTRDRTCTWRDETRISCTIRSLKLSPEKIAKMLVAWFDPNRRPLPWRENLDPYRIWIAEVMLQQTVVTFAARRFDEWVSRFPNIETLASASEPEVLAAWEGLGYYSRARNLQLAAKLIVSERSGKIPADYGELRQLPGIGEYTANAILAFAFDLSRPAIDANVRRVVGRLFGPDEPDNWQQKTSQRFLGAAMESVSPRLLMSAMMELGQTICTVRSPLCNECPVSSDCRARREGRTDALPPRKSINLDRRSELALIACNMDGAILVRKGSQRLFRGMWLLPTAPLHGDADVAVENWCKEMGFEAGEHRRLASITHHYTTNSVLLQPVVFQIRSAHQKLPNDYEWIIPNKSPEHAFPSAHRKILNLCLKTSVKLLQPTW